MEQRYPGPDATPLDPGDGDIERAAAAAAEQAADYGPRPGTPGARGSRRWVVVGGAVIGVLALAGTATALATHRGPRPDVAGVAAQTSDLAPATDGGTSSSSPSDLPTTTTVTTPTTTAATTTKPSPTTMASSSATAPPGATETDCESESHNTSADESMAFSGMQRGAQQAFLAAQAAAKAAGLKFVLNSGYRSAAYQQRIFDCWVKELGSPAAARQFALPPSESAHVKGYAMDIAPPSAATWLEGTDGKFGLCRRYSDEAWHFEYQSYYKTNGCPALLPHP